METLTLFLVLIGFVVLAWLIRYEANRRIRADKCERELQRAAFEGMSEGFGGVISQNQELADTRAVELQQVLEGMTKSIGFHSEWLEKLTGALTDNTNANVYLEMQVRRYPVVRMREKGTGRWISLATAEVIDPATGQVMPGTPVELD